MKRNLLILLTLVLLSWCPDVRGQEVMPQTPLDPAQQQHHEDSISQALLSELQKRIDEMNDQRVVDSLTREFLEKQLAELRTVENIQKSDILDELRLIQEKQQQRLEDRKQYLDSLKQVTHGYPIYGVLNDTIALVYMRIGSYSAEERAKRISQRVETLYEEDFSPRDSLTLKNGDGYTDITFDDRIIMTVLENDALLHDYTTQEYSEVLSQAIRDSVLRAQEENTVKNTIKRVLLVLLCIVLMVSLLKLVSIFFRWLRMRTADGRNRLFRDLKYKDYTFITVAQEAHLVSKGLIILQWVTIIMLFVVLVPIMFSIFPFTRGWSVDLFQTLWKPIENILLAIWHYLPNLINIIVIVVVIRYVIKLVHYIFDEIEQNKLKISGFHPDFAQPTFVIIRSLLIVFGLILVFPFLPGAGSEAFNAVSVFLGLLVSIGSSSAIANMIAGVVITYMRPFKIGDRIKIDGIVGDVTDKTMLVTKIRQITNEEVTIPNSKVLNSNTINYSALVETKGLILSVEGSFGYELPWRMIEEILLEAIGRCPDILPAPKPFVRQTEFRDYDVVYTVNGYTIEANQQARIYSEIRGHIQDVCRERDVEILSPTYHNMRDGNPRTVPPEYHKKEEKKERPVPKVRGEENS